MLRVERNDAFAVWTIDRPEAKNALNLETMDMLTLAVEAAAKDRSLRAVVLTGAGNAFVSGGDLRELREARSSADAERFADVGAALCAGIAALDVPVIAALPGVAYGGGAELALACDMRIADMRAKISFKQVRMGVTTAWGTLPRLVGLVGRGSAGRLLYTAHEISAAEAKITGLIDEVTVDGTCTATAIAWAYDIALGSPRAVAEMKALLRAATSATDDCRTTERARFVGTWTSPDHLEAMESYFERRSPVWRERE